MDFLSLFCCFKMCNVPSLRFAADVLLLPRAYFPYGMLAFLSLFCGQVESEHVAENNMGSAGTFQVLGATCASSPFSNFSE